MTPPVLFLIFNRPDLTKQVFQRIRAAQPPKLFIGADGPREGRSEEPRLCEEARHIATQVDWHCEVHTLFRSENLGCKEAVSSAITWFFEQVEAGIILEDDCVPHPSFFSYCDALLDYYAQDERIFAIGGNNFQPPTRNYGASYYFSVYPHIWGWATWRRAWRHYDGRIEAWPKLKQESWLQGWMGDRFAARYWSNIFDRVHNGEIDSWGYPWTFSIWAQSGLSIVPEVNLVSNIGFDSRGTHTKNPDSPAAGMEISNLPDPLIHPSTCVRKYDWDRYTTANHFGVSYPSDRATQLANKVESEADTWLRRADRLRSEPLSAVSGKIKQIWK